jgi:hypothetical protein
MCFPEGVGTRKRGGKQGKNKVTFPGQQKESDKNGEG